MRLMPMIVALAVLTPSLATAQMAQPDNAPPLTVFRQEWGGDGSVYTLASFTGHEVYFALPFSLDFSAGWGMLAGKRTAELNGMFTEVPAWGAELYGLKYLGGDGMFVRASIRGLFDTEPDSANSQSDDQRFRVTMSLSFGVRLGG